MIDTVLGMIAPHRCSSCEQIGAILCESCIYDIISEPYAFCVLCAKVCGARGLCGYCAKNSGITQAWCVGERRDGLKLLIDRYKFDSSQEASTVCIELLDAVISQLPPDIVVAGIPSSPVAIRLRGFDHMKRIVDLFAKKRKLTVTRPLEKISSVTLHFLSKKERIKQGPFLFRLVAGSVPESILLIDDIVTTGTTLISAVKLLKKAGVKRVYVAVIARQLKD